MPYHLHHAVPHRRSRIYLLLIAATGLWLLAVVAAPLLKAGGWMAGDLLHLSFAGICHQLPERSYWLAGFPLAVCARCWGLYCGFGAGLLLLPWLARPSRQLLKRPRFILVFFIPMAVDLLLHNTHLSRFATGFIATAPVPILLWQAVVDLGRHKWRVHLRRAS